MAGGGGRRRQVYFLAKQTSLIGEFQANDTFCFKKQGG